MVTRLTAEVPRILIVDESDDSREVLRTVLESRGVKILEASAACTGLEIAGHSQPDLIVIDLEAIDDDETYSAYDARSRQTNTPIVVLGTCRRDHPQLSSGQFVSKPYHYGPLIRKIEEMLDKSHLGSRPNET